MESSPRRLILSPNNFAEREKYFLKCLPYSFFEESEETHSRDDRWQLDGILSHIDWRPSIPCLPTVDCSDGEDRSKLSEKRSDGMD
jgi:hypothetical protein